MSAGRASAENGGASSRASAMTDAAKSRALDGAALDAAIVVALKATLSGVVLWLGFSHVSDDDYARVVIAQSFAHAPKLDPSGTSWLPFPFWINGAAMMAFGRSLEVARAVAIVLGAATVAAPYLALRAVGVARGAALAAVVVAMTAPWNAWLGAATVPDAPTGALIAAGAIATASARARPWGAAALAIAALSRYEAWPVCAAMAIAAGVAAARLGGRGDVPRDRARDARDAGERTRALRGALVAIALAVAAPLAWMAWNRHAHADATHFLARVAAFRQASGAAAIPLVDKLLGYPRALVDAAAGLLVLGAVGVAALGDPAMRARWGAPLGASVAMLAFLVYGDVRDGAPTHHPERALVAMLWVIAAFGADGAMSIARRFAWHQPRREMFVVGGIAAFAVTWTASVAAEIRAYPARSPEEQRDAQIARGRELRGRAVTNVVVTPCAYEHFALIAAYGRPEGVTVGARDSRRAVTEGCPGVEPR